MKIAVLWTGLSGYMNACLKELASRDGVELMVSHQLTDNNAPFELSQFDWIKDRFSWRKPNELNPLQERVRAFAPDVLLLAGWHVPAYRRIARAQAGRALRVMIMDNPWKATWKQRFGVLVAPFHVQPLADRVWLPGERQAMFARRLGFNERVTLRGSFSCDQPAFARVYQEQKEQSVAVPRRFLFSGRLILIKGVDTLAEAYKLYRSRTSDPWPLACCGAGPLRSLLEKIPGVEMKGFVQPAEMTQVLAQAGCLILPSTFEPWALVVHEAAAAGRLILASNAVGAAVHLVQPGFNGYVFESGDVEGLAQLMQRVSEMSDRRLSEMSRNSHMLSTQYTPARWADTLLEARRLFSKETRQTAA